MRFRLRLSTDTARDIQNALAYTLQQFGEKKHEEYKALIRDALAVLSTNPQGPPAKRRPEIHPDAYTLHIGQRGKRARHHFLYRVMPDNIVDVARLLHDSMELHLHVPDRFGT